MFVDVVDGVGVAVVVAVVAVVAVAVAGLLFWCFSY